MKLNLTIDVISLEQTEAGFKLADIQSEIGNTLCGVAQLSNYDVGTTGTAAPSRRLTSQLTTEISAAVHREISR